MALPLLPANLIKEGLRAVEEHAIKNKLHSVPGVASLFGYLRHQWIFRAGISIYLMSKTILRTLKVQEDFHDNMASYFGFTNNHLNMWTFIGNTCSAFSSLVVVFVIGTVTLVLQTS